jgi:hypothetical protein
MYGDVSIATAETVRPAFLASAPPLSGSFFREAGISGYSMAASGYPSFFIEARACLKSASSLSSPQVIVLQERIVSRLLARERTRGLII